MTVGNGTAGSSASSDDPTTAGELWVRGPRLDRRELLQTLVAGAALFTAPIAFAKNKAAKSKLDDPAIILTILGILQPASPEDVYRFLSGLHAEQVGSSTGLQEPPSKAFIAATITSLAKPSLALSNSGPYITPVGDSGAGRYSLTAWGNGSLPRKLQRARDRTRLFLLPGPRWITLKASRGKAPGQTGGGAPSQDAKLDFEQLSRPTGYRGPAVHDNRWARIDADFSSGPEVFSRDPVLKLLSFGSLDELRRAGGLNPNDQITRMGLALCLGVSEQLLNYLSQRRFSGTVAADEAEFPSVPRQGQYRQFTVGKKNGGERTIHAPRRFLKAAQRFLLDFFLVHLPVHDTVHSFRAKQDDGSRRGNHSNAAAHVGKKYLAVFDIRDYFGSITARQVRALFDKRLLQFPGGRSEPESEGGNNGLPPVFEGAAQGLIVRLCTIPLVNPLGKGGQMTGVLPQGAPTSPQISNAMLYDFDAAMVETVDSINEKAPGSELTYTRYADDIAISGQTHAAVSTAFVIARRLLWNGRRGWPARRFQVNGRKSRIMGPGSQKLVTGLVVSDKVQPPREFRDRVRAMLNNASKDPASYRGKYAELSGYIGYFHSVGVYSAEQVEEYKRILEQIKN